MKQARVCLKTVISSAILLASSIAMADENTVQQQLDALKTENQMILQRLDATLDMLESSTSSSSSHHGTSGKTTVGGYGELHYGNTDSATEIDMHRFILYLGHEFNDKIRFFSETEVEHAKVTGSGGEVAIEQAFIEFDIAEDTAIRAGILLVPMGIINETHEPPTFYGVERNNVEKYIIPSTWREGGVSITGRLNNSVSYDVALHSGFKISNTNFSVRKGRQAVREAPAGNLALTARMKWTGIAGLEVGGGFQQQSDITQGADPSAGSATLIEAHTIYQHQSFALRALYASWDLSGTGPASVGADKQTGWYLEPSYKFTPKWGVFVRQSNWDNQVNSGIDTASNQLDAGVNYWPHEDVVIKANIQKLDKAGIDDNGFLLGIGYQF